MYRKRRPRGPFTFTQLYGLYPTVAYTNNLNQAIEKLPQLANKSIEDILKNLNEIADPALQATVRNNGGGFYNHNLFFGILGPDGGSEPTGTLGEQIKKISVASLN